MNFNIFKISVYPDTRSMVLLHLNDARGALTSFALAYMTYIARTRLMNSNWRQRLGHASNIYYQVVIYIIVLVSHRSW